MPLSAGWATPTGILAGLVGPGTAVIGPLWQPLVLPLSPVSTSLTPRNHASARHSTSPTASVTSPVDPTTSKPSQTIGHPPRLPDRGLAKGRYQARFVPSLCQGRVIQAVDGAVAVADIVTGAVRASSTAPIQYGSHPPARPGWNRLTDMSTRAA
ncbi:hypothetical protein F4824DRAFT_505227 [Ustulina deusta]|nr:hypothetical protein F4824DRAFT_505227 [Ustulina deusta]